MAQRAVLMLLLEPIYKGDFLYCPYGFRPGRSAHEALVALRAGLVEERLAWVIDADISKCLVIFTSVPTFGSGRFIINCFQ